MTKLIIVGGFLGAGKTTLLMESAKILVDKGHKVGLITNDQAEGLVDSVYLKQSGSKVLEVSGSCFCCNFDGFVGAINAAISAGQVDVIIAEPVGSCTDLNATIVRPLLANYSELVELAPLMVLADPDRLRDSLNGDTCGLHESAAYIYRKQLEDAETILIGKSDMLTDQEIEDLKQRSQTAYPHATIMAISSKKLFGLEDWLSQAMNATSQGGKIVELDYDIYAEGEAVLGWLNAEMQLMSKTEVNWESWFHKMMDELASEIDQEKLTVGHVKAILQVGGDTLLSNITGTMDTLQFRGQINPGSVAMLTINARVQTEPDNLKALVFRVLEKSQDWKGERKLFSLNSLSPGRPNPTHRFE